MVANHKIPAFLAAMLAASVVWHPNGRMPPVLAATNAQSNPAPARDARLPRRPTPEVQSVEDPRAVSDEEKARAAYFGHQPGNVLDRWRAGRRGGPPGPGMPATVDRSPDDPVPTADDVLRDTVCLYDVVVLGTPQRARVLLSEDESALFTDYSVTVERWIKTARPEKIVTISSEGGRVIVSGSLLMDYGDNIQLNLNARYLFFLRRIRNTTSLRLHYREEFPVDASADAAIRNAERAAYLNHLLELARTCSGEQK